MLHKNRTDTEENSVTDPQNPGIRKKIIRFCLLGCAFAFCAVLALTCCAHGPAEFSPAVNRHPGFSAANQENADRTELKLMTLNMAHGRKDGFSQIFQTEKEILSHLDEIADVLNREKPDILALQEADGPCAWSGNFDHVAYLAQKTGFPFWIRGEHVKMPGLSYGTAILSRFPPEKTLSVTFAPSPPTPSKGFVAVSVKQPGSPAAEIRIISVHLDFSRESVRKEQIRSMTEKLSADKIPLIIMGDFNCGWEKGTSAVAETARLLGLKVWQENAKNLQTFPQANPGKRLDWILIPAEYEFAEYRVLDDVLSDHRGVAAIIRKKNRTIISY
ncbi:MAG: endonuclease/exonuclease/phosphatase family protein [Desulfococcaceae bacterium]